ncbi:MAG: hypothetical protein ACRENB_12710 [Gemmatimonadales bacterium]
MSGCIPLIASTCSGTPVGSTKEDGGWTRAGRCGFEERNPSTGCGNWCASGVCDAGTDTCDCGPGHWEPCQYAGYDPTAQVEQLKAELPPLAGVLNPETEWAVAQGERYRRGEEWVRRAMASRRAKLPRRLRELGNELARLSAIHVVAEVEFSGFLDDPIGERKGWSSGLGRYEYWERDGRYHASVEVGVDSGLSQVVDVAYDGHLWQMFMQGVDMLSVTTIPSRVRGTAFRNPLFLPFEELLAIRDWDECAGCELTLADFRAAGASPPASRFSQRLEGGKSWSGASTHYQVAVRGQEERLAAFEEVDASGRTLLRMSFDDYRRVPGSRAWFPARVVVEFPAEAEGRPPDISRYRITTFEVDPEIADDRFRIKRGVRLLVDSDRNRFQPLPKQQ